MIEFLHPGRLLLAAAVLLYWGAAGWQARRRAKEKEKIFRVANAGTGTRRELCFGLGGILLVLALAGPGYWRQLDQVERRGIRIAVAIDVSKSMLAEDVARPARNRIDRARRFVLQLLDHLSGEKIGISVFAAEGFILVPLTRDYGYCRYLVENLDEMAVAAPGSSLAAGLEEALALLAANPEKGEDGAGVIVLLSDGEDLESDPGRALKLASRARRHQIAIWTLGIGRRADCLIPIRTPDGRQIIDYYRDHENNFLTTARTDATLRRLAAAGGGEFGVLDRRLTAAGLLARINKKIHASGNGAVRVKQRLDLSPWLLAAAFSCLVPILAGRENSA
ncbi:MAG: VWA domain-containing protein [Deltaproteobacteria bacterium]|nr:VWA domain-containing protein [Deltaproteobacteria bacterium]